VAVSWVGFDQPKTLGKNQTGGVVALPIWLGYMEKVLGDYPEGSRTLPAGIVTVPTMALSGESKIVPEFFYREAVPPPEVLQPPPPPAPPESPAAPGLPAPVVPAPPPLPAQPNPPA
jgi:penicillin-binding protein 1A